MGLFLVSILVLGSSRISELGVLVGILIGGAGFCFRVLGLWWGSGIQFLGIGASGGVS